MDEDEDLLCRFGTPLEPLDEDEIPSKKPIAVEDQIVTDVNGRRRFHGAFTGGFSAGFWNTVGSLEGWKPQSFKSSRVEKAEAKEQKPIDFMDEEDLGEFGIAPQRVQTTEDFTPQDANSKATSRKRKMPNSSGPIPGVPVLHHLLQPAKDNVAIRLLKKMGWKVGQGIGARQTRKEKKAASERNARELYVMKKYGCDLGPLQHEQPPAEAGSDSDESDLSNEEITFAPDDFEPYICGIKDNTFGLGYTGLSRKPVLKQQQHIDLFGFEGASDDNKKLPIRGQAFGVGALEEEDEDIYECDDMTKYDFSLEEAARKAKPKRELREDSLVIEGFQAAKYDGKSYKKIFTVSIPSDFKPRNWAVRRSRFAPLDESRAALLRQQDEHKTRGLGRHDLNPDERGNILGEGAKKNDEKVKESKPEKKKKSYLERINEKYKREEAKLNALKLLDDKLDDKFAKGEILNEEDNQTIELDESTKKENEKVQAEAVKITKSLDKNAGVFKPFINNQAKQERYEKFLEANLRSQDEIMKLLATVQPLSMSEWDREMEMKEFLQARNIYKPLRGSIADRFVSEAAALAEREIIEQLPTEKKKVAINRTKIPWKPSSLLCKRFNITTTFGGAIPDEIGVKRSRFSVFDYLEPSINTKDNFVTPVILPTKAEKPKLIVQQPRGRERNSESSRLSTKELFKKDISKPKEDIPSISKETTVEVKIDEGSDKDTASTANRSSITPLAKEQPKKATKPKSDLEKKVEESINKHPSEKKDLFKAIFDSSSEDEDEGEREKPEQSSQVPDNANISQDIVNALIKPTDELNILKSTSPPKGLFANLFKRKKPLTSTEGDGTSTKGDGDTKEKLDGKESEVIAPQNSSSNESSSGSDEQQEDGIYGPKIPAKLGPVGCEDQKTMDEIKSPVALNDDMDRRLIKFLKKSKKEAIVEEWVEKAEISSSKERKKKKKEKDKKKKSKKHKKEKKKHKDKK